MSLTFVDSNIYSTRINEKGKQISWVSFDTVTVMSNNKGK